MGFNSGLKGLTNVMKRYETAPSRSRVVASKEWDRRTDGQM